ncbi:MAG: nuclear transport factor 2 family protein [Blastocatellia bacterium]|nr:nuclear transport factor 2 family protein [Blastocatellia bacterium]
MNKLILFLAISFLFVMPISAQVDSEREAIRRAALNYAEGWYEGNADKMESSLHPDLAKRIVRTNDKGQSGLNQMSALSLVQGTRTGSGKQTPTAEQQKDVAILDVIGGAATVKLEMRDWVDYMHVGKFNGKWVIVNVFWELKPKKDEKKN